MRRMTNIFTFWEGPMPAYIKLCMQTWKFPYTMLNYDNLHDYTDLDAEKIKRFTLPKVADAVRAHVLRDHGGYWLDTDTIMVTGQLPKTMVIGDPNSRTHTGGFLYAEKPGMDFFVDWSQYQDAVIEDLNCSSHWSVMINAFTDPYIGSHPEIDIHPVRSCWPETYMIHGDIPRYAKYNQFYFNSSYFLSDLEPTDMLMLHNSWTPGWYKKLDHDEVLTAGCTLSNILLELTERNKA